MGKDKVKYWQEFGEIRNGVCHISMKNLRVNKSDAEFIRDFELLNEKLRDLGFQEEWLETCEEYTFHSQFSGN